MGLNLLQLERSWNHRETAESSWLAWPDQTEAAKLTFRIFPHRTRLASEVRRSGYVDTRQLQPCILKHCVLRSELL